MSANKYGTPWKIEAKEGYYLLVDFNGNGLARVGSWNDAERICACVNAFKGKEPGDCVVVQKKNNLIVNNPDGSVYVTKPGKAWQPPTKEEEERSKERLLKWVNKSLSEKGEGE